ncbi:MAG: hypothetical protein COA95_03980 [Methylophaga sp.]|nr:MAG: hypothetical protein COA95_03980 [Methylophaga sp.]
MTKSTLFLFASIFASSIVSAEPYARLNETNSISRAALEIMAMHNPPQQNVEHVTPYTHESEKNNSLGRAALAKQGTKVNLRFNSDSVIRYSRDVRKSDNNNSFFRRALAR